MKNKECHTRMTLLFNWSDKMSNALTKISKLQLLLDAWTVVQKYSLERGYSLGICRNLSNCYHSQLIDHLDYYLLAKDMKENIPEAMKHLNTQIFGISVLSYCWWDVGDSKSRDMYIKSRIKAIKSELKLAEQLEFANKHTE